MLKKALLGMSICRCETEWKNQSRGAALSMFAMPQNFCMGRKGQQEEPREAMV